MDTVESRLLDYVSGERVEMLDLLERLVNINSFTDNPAGVEKVVGVLLPLMREIDLLVEVHPDQRRGPTIVAQTPGSGRSEGTRVLMLGHTDTVFSPDDDFQTYRRDGENAYGPGVVDMKGGIVVMLYALRALHSAGVLNDTEIKLVLNSDEEQHSLSSRGILEQAALTSDLALVFEGGRIEGGVVTSRKAVGEYIIRVNGRAAHAGANHEQGISALRALAAKVADWDALTDYDRGITVTTGVIKAGTRSNIVPDQATAYIDVRYPDRGSLRPLDRAIRQIAHREDVPGTSVSVEALHSRPPMPRTPQNEKLYEIWAEVSRGLGQPIREVATGGASDANIAASCNIPSLDGLGPIGGRSHSADEWVDIRSLVERAQACAVGLLRLTSMPPETFSAGEG